jgi:hypothetical protein
MDIKGTPWKLSVSKKDGARWYDFGEGWKMVDGSDSEKVLKFEELRRFVKDSSKTEEEIINKARNYRPYFTSTTVAIDKTVLCNSLIKFFSEFHFEPNYRFVNTLALMCGKSKDYAKRYIYNYFCLTDSAYTESVKEKMESYEFETLISELQSLEIKNKINHRFKLYYGSQGTGKTTQAMAESDVCMVCHSAILPQDLMEDFSFEDGKPNFKGSAFKDALVNGKVIVLDEINLLPFETVRFLQSVLDGKEEFTYKGENVRIHPDFKVIGTMNLVVNGCTYGLPEPLVDRAEELREFNLTPEMLCSALI